MGGDYQCHKSKHAKQKSNLDVHSPEMSTCLSWLRVWCVTLLILSVNELLFIFPELILGSMCESFASRVDKAMNGWKFSEDTILPLSYFLTLLQSSENQSNAK